MQYINKNWPSIILIFCVALLYVMTSPTTVQTGDTGEIVTNGYLLTVIHPPGYPLQTLYTWLSTHILPGSTIFQKASIGTIILTLIALWQLIVWLRKISTPYWFLWMPLIAVSAITWKYAVLPDVFAGLFLFSILFIRTLFEPEIIKKWPMVLLLALSVAHHHTIIFLLPCLLYALIQQRNHRPLFWQCPIFLLLALSSYGLILLFSPEAYTSWGHISGFNTLFEHFVRKEYGTFSLAADNTKVAFLDNFTLFLNYWVMNYWSIPLLLILNIKQAGQHLRSITSQILVFIAVSYIAVFFPAANVGNYGFGLEVIERFFILPSLVFTLLGIHLISAPTKKYYHYATTILICANLATSLITNLDKNQFSRATEVDFILKNQMGKLPSDSIFAVQGDTSYFAARYLQFVEGFRPDILVYTPGMRMSWMVKKINSAYPHINFENGVNLESLNPTANHIYSSYGSNSLFNKFATKNEGSVYHFTKVGSGLTHDCQARPWHKSQGVLEQINLSHFEFRTSFLLHSLGLCEYELAINQILTGNYEEAKASLIRALEINPFHYLAQERLCFILKNKLHDTNSSMECDKRLDQLIERMNPDYINHMLEKSSYETNY